MDVNVFAVVAYNQLGTEEMPCLLVILVVMFPRIAILLLYFFTNFFQSIYESILVPLAGFIFLPLTLIAYTWLTREHRPVDAFYLVLIFVAVVLDLGLLGGGEASRRRSRTA
jgi:hypothetical protein